VDADNGAEEYLGLFMAPQSRRNHAMNRSLSPEAPPAQDITKSPRCEAA
jgi:hypothetical protein